MSFGTALQVHLLDFPNIVIKGSELSLPFQALPSAVLVAMSPVATIRCRGRIVCVVGKAAGHKASQGLVLL